MIIYVLMVEYWSNPHYNTEIVSAYTNLEDAEFQRELNQGTSKTCDIQYYIQEVELL